MHHLVDQNVSKFLATILEHYTRGIPEEEINVIIFAKGEVDHRGSDKMVSTALAKLQL